MKHGTNIDIIISIILFMKEGIRLKKFIFLFPVISGILWGSAGIFVRTLTKMNMNSYTIVESRVILAVLILGAGIYLYDKSLLKIKLKDVWVFLGGGILGMFGLNVCYNIAIEELTLSLSAVLLSLSPLFVLILAAIIFREKITSRKILCMIMAIVGCILASGVLESSSGMKWSVYGIAVGTMGAIFYAMYSIFTKLAIQRGYGPLTITFYCLLTVFIVLIPLTDWNVIASSISSSPINMSIFMVVHALCTSVLPYVMYTVSLDYIEAGKASILASGEPIAAMIFGIIFYSEIPTLISLTGLFLVICAITLLSAQPEKKYKEINVNS